MKRLLVLPATLALLTACGGAPEEDAAADAANPAATSPAVAEDAAGDAASDLGAGMAQAADEDGAATPVVDAATATAPGEKMAADAAIDASATAAAATTMAAATPPASFAQCKVCHAVEPGKNGLGPSLAGVFGAKAGHEPKFNYSPAMRDSGKVWDAASLDAYLENPRAFIPGNRMSFAGMRDAAKRKEVIEYLKTL